MRPYMVMDPYRGLQLEVAARTPKLARDIACATWEAGRMQHSPKGDIQVYEKLDAQEEARRDKMAESSLQFHRDGRGAIIL